MADEKKQLQENSNEDSLTKSVSCARKELAKLRRDVKEMKYMFVKRFEELELMLLKHEKRDDIAVQQHFKTQTVKTKRKRDLLHTDSGSKEKHLASGSIHEDISSEDMRIFRVIGHIRSCFKEKNGIPRQGAVCPKSKAQLVVDGVEEFTNPEHSLQGLEHFSHVWVIFVFHKNTNHTLKAKVCPPRLDGKKVGVFASRSPHRPSAIGLTLACLDAIQGNTLHLSGVDILDGTPILDIKPYVPVYDCVADLSHTTSHHKKHIVESGCSKSDSKQSLTNLVEVDLTVVTDLPSTSIDSPINIIHKGLEDNRIPSENIEIANWIRQPQISPLAVTFSAKALENLEKFHHKSENVETDHDLMLSSNYELEFFTSPSEVREVIERILAEDPRSVHRRNNCPKEIYHFTVDKVNVSCLFDSANSVEVLDVEPKI